MARASMAACGTRSPVFIDDVTADRSSRRNCEVSKAILSAQIQPDSCNSWKMDVCFTLKLKLKICFSIVSQPLKASLWFCSVRQEQGSRGLTDNTEDSNTQTQQGCKCVTG